MAKHGHVGRSFKIPMYDGPYPKQEGQIDFPRLDGGLNIFDLNYRLKPNESPDIRNLLWKNGALGCRPGQVLLAEMTDSIGYCCYEKLYEGRIIAHIGKSIYSVDPDSPAFELLYSGLNESRGTFFRYGDHLYYKNKGGYVVIKNNDGALSAAPVEAYTPVTYINMDPVTHAGESYQPENRLSAYKTLWYNANGDSVYHLPEQGLDEVLNVSVDGANLAEGTDYTVDLVGGTVTFKVAPPVSDPFFANTVKLTYKKHNNDLYNSVMDCNYAIVYGGNQSLCVVFGGCPAQPNAYFWNGNHVAMDAGYFPAEQYNLAGDTQDAITAFGLQQNMLVIFKKRSIGRAVMDVTTTDSDRLLLEMPYTAINAEIGCDLPWTVQLINNNLVFCNTRQGVHMVLDSSSAYEQNIVPISQKVNGGINGPGLLYDVHMATENSVCSFDDNSRYWLVADGNVYAWDYDLSTRKDPAWFFFTNIKARSFASEAGKVFHVDGKGRITELGEGHYSDYGEAIEKVYQFATQNMGSYEKLKDVRSVLFTVRSNTDTEVSIRYDTDYEQRYDLTPILSYSWKLSPRNLAYRYLGVPKYAHVERREPLCRNIKHFSMRLENNIVGQDMAVMSAQLFYNFQGRYR